MSLYQCEECGCCENTALGYYWGETRKLCSECAPEKYHDHTNTGLGKWHGQFPKVLLPKGMFVTNKEGNLAHKDTGDTDYRKYAMTTPAPKGE